MKENLQISRCILFPIRMLNRRLLQNCEPINVTHLLEFDFSLRICWLLETQNRLRLMRLLRLLSLLWSFRSRWLCNGFNISCILERFLTPFTPLRHAWSMITSHIPSQMVVLLDWMVVPKTSGRFFSFTIGTIGAIVICNCLQLQQLRAIAAIANWLSCFR